MALTKTFTGTDFSRFEYDLLSVLKADPEHKIDFDGKLLFRSRQYDCLLAATDVHWDEKSGDIVLVGAFRSGKPVMDESKDYPVMKTRISVPLKECFEDLKLSSGSEMKLVSKAKKAVLDKYFTPLVNLYKSRGMFDGNLMDLESFDCGYYRLGDSFVVALAEGSDGKVNLVCSNSFNPNFDLEPGKASLKDIQNFSEQLSRIMNRYREASDLYLETMHKLHPVSVTLTPLDEKKNVSASLVAVYESGCPAKILDCVSKHMAGLDFFDTEKYSKKDISGMMENFKKTGVLQPVKKNNLSNTL